MADKGLEKIFQRTAQGQSGSCPLPEPGRGAPHLEHPKLARIEKQPEGYDYDRAENEAEAKRFRESVNEAARTGQITQEEAEFLLQKVN